MSSTNSKPAPRGRGRLTSTLYFRFIRSTTTSTWSWPTPETRSCLVSGSKWYLTVGSSSAMRASAFEVFASLPRAGGFHPLLGLPLKPRHLPHPLPSLLGGVVDLGIGLEGAGVHAEDGELADVGLAPRLEAQRRP